MNWNPAATSLTGDLNCDPVFFAQVFASSYFEGTAYTLHSGSTPRAHLRRHLRVFVHARGVQPRRPPAEQVSLGVLFTAVAFHLGLKTIDVYPKVPYIMFIDRVFLLNMLVMVLCVVSNNLSYALHSTCKEDDDDYQTRSTWDWVLLGVIASIWVFSNVWFFYSVIQEWSENGRRTGWRATIQREGSRNHSNRRGHSGGRAVGRAVELRQ